MEDIHKHYETSTCIIFATSLLIIGYTIFSWVFKTVHKNLPPGPREWGITLKMLKASRDDSLHELAFDWAKKYGPITYVNFLGRPLAILNSADLVRRIFTSDKYKLLVGNRVPNAPSKLAWFGGKDLIFTTYDAIMRKKRRLFHKVMGLYGDGVERFEKVVSGEMDRLLEELEQHENQDLELWRHISRSLKQIIYILALGERPEDITKPDILEEYDIAFNKLWAADIDFVLTNLPILAKVPGRIKKAVDRLMVAKAGAEELMYFAPKRTWVPDQPRGIADHLFDLQKKPGYEWMDNDPEEVIGFLTSLFLAAHLTSRGALHGIFLSLLNYPNVVKKIHEEIDRVIGTRKPKLEDKFSMPYTDATLWETLRILSQTPLGSLRTASEDIHFDGMTIPKNTLVLLNSWFVHHNEDVWEDPWTFKPERYLDSSGQSLPLDHSVMKNSLPFGAGVRACPGENFARSRVFLFVTNILQKYDVLPPESEKLVPADFRTNDDAVKGFIRQVRPFKCRLQRRQKTGN